MRWSCKSRFPAIAVILSGAKNLLFVSVAPAAFGEINLSPKNK
jgi:hypothetical protein